MRKLIFFHEAFILKEMKGGSIMDLKIEVTEIRERCGAKHKVGDVFYIRGQGTIEIPDGKKLCVYALNSLFPFLTTKQREDELSNDDWVAETKCLNCPDPKGVTFKITTL